MKIHPKQFFEAVKHIREAWIKGCKCTLCQSVDKRKNFVVK